MMFKSSGPRRWGERLVNTNLLDMETTEQRFFNYRSVDFFYTPYGERLFGFWTEFDTCRLGMAMAAKASPGPAAGPCEKSGLH